MGTGWVPDSHGGMQTREPPGEVTRTFAEIARMLFDAESVDQTLQRIVHLAAETVEGCDYAGVSFVERGGEINTPVATHPVVAGCDGLQYEFGEGPCLSAIWEKQTFESEDLTRERRWPRWSPRAVELGAGSMMSFRLFVKESTLGALNLYAGRPGAFDDVDREMGLIFASHAAIALSGAVRQAQLDAAIVVGKAMGMLMERGGITSEQAFDLLQRAAERTSLKLREVAERVWDAGNPAPEAAPAR